MKNSIFLSALLATLFAAGCATRDAAGEADLQFHIDSSVHSRVSRLQADLQHRNDSLIDAAARRRADSTLAAGRP